MKIIDKLKHHEETKSNFCSFEFFPPKTHAGVDNLYSRMDRMAILEPLFIDITWGAGGLTAEKTIDICVNTQKYIGVEVLMHITCTNLTIHQIKEYLIMAKKGGIKNILALRGDPERGSQKWTPCKNGLNNACDLVKLIRQEHGDYFGIAVGAHPEGHHECESMEKDIFYLKEKVNAGADFIMTQFFYDTNIFFEFVKNCRSMGITCPILPGIMPIQNYRNFQLMTNFCKTNIPEQVLLDLEPIKDDDNAVKQYGIQLATEMGKQIFESGVSRGLHFYTLNLEKSSIEILENLGVHHSAATRRLLPWRSSKAANRVHEDVRPIHWANRPKSYLTRTDQWDEFPNGRWGDSTSPAFGDLEDMYYFMQPNLGTTEERKAMWGECPMNEKDIFEVFANYIKKEIPFLPWCEQDLQVETTVISESLVNINQAGYLTVNSQPAVNGVKSDDPIYGWGGAGGRVYQKAYVELFCSPDNLKHLMAVCNTKSSIKYYASNASGDFFSNGTTTQTNGGCVTALTWGVHPEREILQPTIFDPATFIVWKDEAFQLWLSLWGSLYDDDTKSNELLNKIYNNFYLVAIIENDYIDGNLWDIFDTISHSSDEKKIPVTLPSVVIDM